jgi:hypothetical protein
MLSAAGPVSFSFDARGAELSGVTAGLDALADFEAATATPPATATSSPSPTPEGVTSAEMAPTEMPVPPIDTPLPPTETPAPPAATLEPTPTALLLSPTPEPPTLTPEPPTLTPEPPTATLEPPTPTFAVPSDIPLLGRFVPTATPTATATMPPRQGPDLEPGPEGFVAAKVTRYADSLEGNTMACGGEFDQDNPYIIAVSLPYDTVWPCGTPLEVCGTAGCITGIRTDTCPGCPGADIDMTRAGVDAVCGNQTGCDVVIREDQ